MTASPQQAVGIWQKSNGLPYVERTFQRRKTRPNDVLIDIKYCGVCHSDLVMASVSQSIMPGHEIAGVVLEVGSEVGDTIKVGDRVGVGLYTEACNKCKMCTRGNENYCKGPSITTINGAVPGWVEKPEEIEPSFERTLGGFSTRIVADYRCVAKIPDNLDLARAAPLSCSGVTVFTPLKRHEAGPGKVVAVMGLGGLGHIAIKMAKAMGAEVIAVSSSERKKEYALKELGADRFLVSTDKKALEEAKHSIDIMIDTVGEPHQPAEFFDILESQGVWVLLGINMEPYRFSAMQLFMRGLVLAGSYIGSITDLREMFELCGKHNIQPDVLVVPFTVDSVNDTMGKMSRYELPVGKSRYVFDMGAIET